MSDSEQVVHKIFVGDTKTPLKVRLKQPGETGYEDVDLTNLGNVKFKMVASDGSTKRDWTNATKDNSSQGKVSYDFQAADVDTEGTFYGYFRVYDADGNERDTFPNEVENLMIEIQSNG